MTPDAILRWHRRLVARTGPIRGAVGTNLAGRIKRMESMGRPSRYSPEVRERAVRMVLEHEHGNEATLIRTGWRSNGRCASAF